MTTEFKIVPVTLVTRAIEALTRHLSQHAPMQVPPSENDSDLVREDLRHILCAPTPPQPIYDEAKERELFDAWFTSVAGFWQSGGLDGRKASLNGWLACAQSRAKAGEVGHE